MIKIIVKISILVCVVFFAHHIFGQDIDQQKSISNSVDKYLKIVSSQSALYYGRLYDGQPRTETHPYLKDSKYAKSTLLYCEIFYPEELLLLDWNKNELIILTPDYNNVVLFPENLEYAELHGYKIIYLQKESLPENMLEGYYILLHSGKHTVLEKQTARLIIGAAVPGKYSSSEVDFDKKIRFYLNKNEIYYPILNKRGLLRQLKPHKKELRKFISSNNWRFRRDAEELITKTVKEYENLLGVQ
ncbi:MAG: hypothetical protein FWH18_09260 [Marinilabiliaceae bacterium]|nr:hypothetical protein [Marinilabiliaceae bacterium]